MTLHEIQQLDARLKADIDRFNKSHDTPRSDARPLHDKYDALYDIKELVQRSQ